MVLFIRHVLNAYVVIWVVLQRMASARVLAKVESVQRSSLVPQVICPWWSTVDIQEAKTLQECCAQPIVNTTPQDKPRSGRKDWRGKTWRNNKFGAWLQLGIVSRVLRRIWCWKFVFSDLDACEPKRRFAVVQGSDLQVLRRLVRT